LSRVFVKPSSNFKLHQLRTAAIVTAAALLVVAISNFIARGNFSALALIVGGFGLIMVAVYWQAGFYVVLILTFVEGFARNYFNSPMLLLVKDLALVVIYVRVFGERLLKHQPLFYKASFNKPLTILLVVALVQLFNPNIHAIEVGLVGLRSGFLYMPVVFLVPELINSPQARQFFGWFLLIVALPIALYGIIQFYQGPETYYSLGPGFQQATFITIGEFSNTKIFRPNSTFSWPSQYAAFLSFVFLFAVGQAFQSGSKLKWLAWAELPLLVYAIMIEGQRTDFILLPVAVIGMFLAMGRFKLSLPLVIPLVLGVVLVLNTEAGSIFLDRFSTISQNKDEVLFTRLAAGWGNTVNGLTLSPIGVGTGMATLGAQYVNDSIPYFFEGYYGKIAAELGWVGLAVYLLLLLVIAKFMLQSFRKMPTISEKWLVLPLIAFLFVSYYRNFTSNYLDLAVVNLFFWFSIGYVFSLQDHLENLPT
jgi:hypothetical protein